MRLRLVFGVVGRQLQYFSPTFAAPVLLALWDGDPRSAGVFLLSLFVCLGVGSAWHRGYEQPRVFWRAEALAVVSGTWLAVAAAAAVPYLGFGLSVIDAYFEAMSGLTTTGSTVIVGLDSTLAGVLLWRALLQWLGGIGIIAMAIAILPLLQVGGMQLFRMESSDASDKVMPRAAQIVTAIAVIYVALTLICALLYWLFGMSGFDAMAHAMTTIATGGFSTHDDTIGYFRSARIAATATVFMIVGGLPFVLYLQALWKRALERRLRVGSRALQRVSREENLHLLCTREAGARLR